MLRIAAAVLTAGLVLASPVQAGKFNKKLSIGDRAPAWSGLQGTDGKVHAMAELKGKDVVVVAFICNHCPVAIDHEDRLIAVAKKFAGSADSKAAVVAISVDLSPADRLDKMKERAKEKAFNFAYLHDPSQKMGRDYGVRVTPSYFVLDKQRKIAYMGSMDDDPTGQKVNAKYLEAAIEAVAGGGKPAEAETMPFGCGIEYAKKKD